MRLKWQWFLGGRVMFWISIIVLVILILGITVTYVIDPTSTITMKEQDIDPSSIRDISRTFMASYGIKVDKPIVYRYVKFHCNKNVENKPGQEILLGSFHEWNGKYYIDISADLYNTTLLTYIVIHETKHMLVRYMKVEHIIDLSKYTEEIAKGKDTYYDQLFNGAINLLKNYQKSLE